jgi:hypothetical protein
MANLYYKKNKMPQRHKDTKDIFYKNLRALVP